MPLVSGARHHSEYSFWSAADRLHRMGAAERLNAGLRHAEMLDLALGDQVLDRAGDVLDRHVRVDPVLVEQVDGLDAEPLQRAVDRLPDVLGPAVDAAIFARLGIEVEAELGGDHDLIAERRERFADDFLVLEGAIDFGRIEEGHAALDRGADQRDTVFLRQLWHS